jgi:wyosine [tRNA(Phe)-imidazoG37] synthetase (radical SAM superfamily)
VVLKSTEHRTAGPDVQAPASTRRSSGFPLYEVTLPEMDARRARGVIYGPVRSRRLGYSLGLNVLPQGAKRCPFNCVYCEVGAATPVRCGSADDDYPAPDVALAALETVLTHTPSVEAITFSGSGEPTLHPRFYELVEGVTWLRDRHWPTAKVVILSNAALAGRSEVRAGLALADVRLMKLDAGDAATYDAVNRPADTLSFEQIVDNLGRLDDVIVQTMLLDGAVSNVGAAARAAYLCLVRELRPTGIQLYSIARGTPVTGIRAVAPERLRSFAAEIERETGIPVEVY